MPPARLLFEDVAGGRYRPPEVTRFSAGIGCGRSEAVLAAGSDDLAALGGIVSASMAMLLPLASVAMAGGASAGSGAGR